MDDRPYYYRVRGRTLGPVEIRQIRQLVRRAQIGRSTDVSRDGFQWGKASDFPEIFYASGAEPPATTTGSLGSPNFSRGGPASVPGGATLPPVVGQRWYYTANGVQQGPVDMSTIQQMVANGSVLRSEYVIPEGGSQWLPIASVPHLALPTPSRSPAVASGSEYVLSEWGRPIDADRIRAASCVSGPLTVAVTGHVTIEKTSKAIKRDFLIWAAIGLLGLLMLGLGVSLLRSHDEWVSEVLRDTPRGHLNASLELDEQYDLYRFALGFLTFAGVVLLLSGVVGLVMVNARPWWHHG